MSTSTTTTSSSSTTTTTKPQYDAIGTKYDFFRTHPITQVEAFNLRAAVTPYLVGVPSAQNGGRGPRVLDLACGTGHYSRKLLDWGAAYVLGVDVSPEMIEAANQESSPNTSSGKLEFRVGDALTMGRIVAEDDEEDLFDIVTGVWLLNYAEDSTQMTQMWNTISANLSGGGVFIGILPPGPHSTSTTTTAGPVPSGEQLDRFTGRINAKFSSRDRIKRLDNWSLNYFEKLESGDGWRLEVKGGEPGPGGENQVVLRALHLGREIFESSARRGGMKGSLEWREAERPENALEIRDQEWWDAYFEVAAHMSVLIVGKE